MFFTETNIRKLDYTLKTAEERKAFVDNLMQELPKSQLNNKAYIEVLLLKETVKKEQAQDFQAKSLHI